MANKTIHGVNNDVKELIDSGIDVREPKLTAITQNREGRIIWLEEDRFIYIVDGHYKDFNDLFDVSTDPRTIGKFIFETTTKNQIHKTLPGAGGQSKVYVHRFGAMKYIHVLVLDDGSITTAFPRKYDY